MYGDGGCLVQALLGDPFLPLWAITDVAGRNVGVFCDCKGVLVKDLVEGRRSEVEGERPRQTLLTIKSQYSHGA